MQRVRIKTTKKKGAIFNNNPKRNNRAYLQIFTVKIYGVHIYKNQILIDELVWNGPAELLEEGFDE